MAMPRLAVLTGGTRIVWLLRPDSTRAQQPRVSHPGTGVIETHGCRQHGCTYGKLKPWAVESAKG